MSLSHVDLRRSLALQAELSDANSERAKMRQIVDEVLCLGCD